MATRNPRKKSKKEIKAAADRAEARSKGEDTAPTTSPVLDPPETPRGRGRPTEYTAEIGDLICERLAIGMSLRAACRPDDVVAESTARGWTKDPKHPFAAQYVRARELGYLALADETLEISDDASNDWMMREGKDGESLGWAVNGDHIQRSRLRVDTRKWLLSKCLPKIFGDRVTTEVTGKDGGPIETKDVSEVEVARKVAFLLGRAVGRGGVKSDTPA